MNKETSKWCFSLHKRAFLFSVVLISNRITWEQLLVNKFRDLREEAGNL